MTQEQRAKANQAITDALMTWRREDGDVVDLIQRINGLAARAAYRLEAGTDGRGPDRCA